MKNLSKIALPISLLFVLLAIGVCAVYAFSASRGTADETIDVASNATFVEVTDLDADGKADIIVNSVVWDEFSNFELRDRGDSQITIYHLPSGAITPKALYGPQQGGSPFGIAVGRFDNTNDKLDIAVVEKDGSGCFQVGVLASPLWSETIYDAVLQVCQEPQNPIVPTAIAAGRLVSPNYDDIVVASAEVTANGAAKLINPRLSLCSVVEADGISLSCSLFPVDIISDPAAYDPVYAIAVGDVGNVSFDGNTHYEQDGLNDIVAVTRTGRVIILYRYVGLDSNNQPVDTFVKNEIVQAQKNSLDVAIADIDNDGDNDIIVANANDNKVVAYRQELNVPFDIGWIKTLNTDPFPAGLAVNDVNSDGINDVLVSNGLSNYIEVFIQNVTAGLPSFFTYKLGSDRSSIFGIGTGDLNSDGFNDVAAASMDKNVLSVYLQEALFGVPELNPVIPVIPRLATISKNIYVYNVPPDYAPCTFSRTGGAVKACNDIILVSENCGPSKSVLTLNGNTSMTLKGTYTLRTHPSPSKELAEQTIKVGEIVVTPSLETNRLLRVTTSKDILGVDGKVSYNLFRKDACTLTLVESGEFTQTVPESHKMFHTDFLDPACNTQQCNYVVEVLAQTAGDVGGAVSEFTYAPSLSGVFLQASANKNTYQVGESAYLRALIYASGQNNFTITYNITSPASLNGTGGPFAPQPNQNNESWVSLPLTVAGSYTVNIIVSNASQSWKKISVPLSFVVGAPNPVSVSSQNLDFGTLAENKTGEKNVTLRNTGNTSVTGVSVTIPSQLAVNGVTYVLKNTTLPPNATVDLTIKVRIPIGAADGNFSDYIRINGLGMKEESISVALKIYTELTLVNLNLTGNLTTGGSTAGVIAPSAWALGGVAAGSTAQKLIIPSISGASASDYKVTVSIEGDAANYVSTDKNEILDLSAGGGATLSVSAPAEVGDYSANVVFEFVKKSDSSILVKKSLPVSFTVESQENALIKDAKGRLIRVKSALSTAQMKAGAGTSASEEVQTLVSAAEGKISEAEEALTAADAAASTGNDALIEQTVSTANEALNTAEDVVSQISASLSATSQTNASSSGGGLGAAFVVIIIIVSVLVVFGLLIFAFREGWLPIGKVPWLKSMFETVGLGSLIEPAHDFSPELKFSPVVKPAEKRTEKPTELSRPPTMRPGIPFKPSEQLPRPSFGPAGGVKPQMPPETEGLEAPPEEEPPEQEQQKYTSYYNRRFQPQ